MIGTEELVRTSEVAHNLLLFVEKVVLHLRKLRQRFQSSHEVELSYTGPTGNGFQGTPLGCQSFSDEIGVSNDDIDDFLHQALSLRATISGNDQDEVIEDLFVDVLNDGMDPTSANRYLSNLVTLLRNFAFGTSHDA